MIRLILLLYLLFILAPKTHGQFTVYQDEKGQVLTRVDEYATDIGSTSHRELFYQGSPFLTFPVWQPAIMRLDESGQEVVCELAYDLVMNEVMCRFAGSSAVKTVTPNAFTINGTEYVRQQNKSVGLKHHSYLTTIHSGSTKLLVSLSKYLKANYTGNTGYDRDLNFKGSYKTIRSYYIQKGNARPELISLSKNSLLKVLYEQATKIAAELPAEQLTTEQMIETLIHYDSLMAAASTKRPPLSNDPVFNQILHEKIVYPNQAWNQGVYGRVYVGFEITEQGSVRNIVLLSPENIGFGFTETVRNGLVKLPSLNPSLSGRYALPVAFTYSNSEENSGAHIPVNRLPDDRFENRTILEEIVVPAVVSKPVTTSKEVWGYYK